MIYESGEPFCEDITLKLPSGKLHPYQTKYTTSTGHLGKEGGLFKVMESAANHIINGCDFDVVERITYVVSYKDGKLHDACDASKFFIPFQERTATMFDEFMRKMKSKWSKNIIDHADHESIIRKVYDKIEMVKDTKSIEDRLESIKKSITQNYREKRVNVIGCEYHLLGRHVILQTKGQWVKRSQLEGIIENACSMSTEDLLKVVLSDAKETPDVPSTMLIIHSFGNIVKSDATISLQNFMKICRMVAKFRDGEDSYSGKLILNAFRLLINNTEKRMLGMSDTQLQLYCDFLVRRSHTLTQRKGGRGDLLIPYAKNYQKAVRMCLPYMNLL